MPAPQPPVDPALSPDLVRTVEAKELLKRPLFVTVTKYLARGALGGHIAVNGYDLKRVEQAAYDLGYAAGHKAARKTPTPAETTR